MKYETWKVAGNGRKTTLASAISNRTFASQNRGSSFLLSFFIRARPAAFHKPLVCHHVVAMSAYEDLLREAFRRVPEPARFLSLPTLAAYDDFQRASTAELSFRFERVRLAVAMSILQLLADLGNHEDSRRVVDVLHRALRARSVAEIDANMHKEVKTFERLYTNLYVNEEGEQLLNLFERALDADSKPLLDGVISDATLLARELDFTREDDEDE
jgi:hypothetical protein